MIEVPFDVTTVSGFGSIKGILKEAINETQAVQKTTLTDVHMAEIVSANKYLWRKLKEWLEPALWQTLQQPGTFGLQRKVVTTSNNDGLRLVWKLLEMSRKVKSNEIAELMARIAASPTMFRDSGSLATACTKMITILDDAAKLDVAIRWESCGYQIREKCIAAYERPKGQAG